MPDEVCSALYAKAGYEDRSRGHSFVIRALLGRGYSCSFLPPENGFTRLLAACWADVAQRQLVGS